MKKLFLSVLCIAAVFCCVADGPFDATINGPVYSKWKQKKMGKAPKEKPARTKAEIMQELKQLEEDYQKNECHRHCSDKYHVSYERKKWVDSFNDSCSRRNHSHRKGNYRTVHVDWTCPEHHYTWDRPCDVFAYSKEQQRIRMRVNELKEELKRCSPANEGNPSSAQ